MDRPILKSICRDGIIDQSCWESAYKRVLFVLKEANDGRDTTSIYDRQDKPVWHLLEYLNVNTKKPENFSARGRPLGFLSQNDKTYPTIAKWGFWMLDDFRGTRPSRENLVQTLRSIAAINIKKIPGKPISTGLELDFAEKDKEFLREQITSLSPQPNVIVECGAEGFRGVTLRLFDENYVSGSESSTLHALGIKIIHMRHPNRSSNKESFDKLKRQYQC